MTTITVTRNRVTTWRGADQDCEVEIDVEVNCKFYKGETTTRDCPGYAPYCEFESATVDDMDFELTDEEIDQAETACYEEAMEIDLDMA